MRGQGRVLKKPRGVSNHGAKVNKGEKLLFDIRSLGSLKTVLEKFWRIVALAMFIQPKNVKAKLDN